ncbi:hypothetical protein ACFSGX_03510 [Sphingomonas arantia]|uniref:Uncharacterized protein n=1 Tax=Sphingomonas arantia TaxID=1460676 RepID=A0ABW4TT32_9SPHN
MQTHILDWGNLRIDTDGSLIVVSLAGGTCFSLAPQQALEVSQAFHQAAIDAEGSKAWLRPGTRSGTV